jgi:hypothetical protein
MSRYEIEMLGAYNAEVAHGMVHTDEWRAAMVKLQCKFNLHTYGTETPVRGKLYPRPAQRTADER